MDEDEKPDFVLLYVKKTRTPCPLSDTVTGQARRGQRSARKRHAQRAACAQSQRRVLALTLERCVLRHATMLGNAARRSKIGNPGDQEPGVRSCHAYKKPPPKAFSLKCEPAGFFDCQTTTTKGAKLDWFIKLYS